MSSAISRNWSWQSTKSANQHWEKTLAKPFFDTDKYTREPASPTVIAFHKAIKNLVRSHMETGGDWNAFVFGEQENVVTADALQAIENAFLKTGHRYQGSAMISIEEEPEKYQHLATTTDSEIELPPPDAEGRILCGTGDNVVQFSENTTGTALYVRASEQVLSLLEDGVPDYTIAIIDDSGGTLTAPVLEYFKGVVCMGGTVRSHLGILCREYGIPCLMNSGVAGIVDGDAVEMETSAAAKTAEAYQNNIEMTANIWKQN
jgi:hypothetical protein